MADLPPKRKEKSLIPCSANMMNKQMKVPSTAESVDINRQQQTSSRLRSEHTRQSHIPSIKRPTEIHHNLTAHDEVASVAHNAVIQGL
jgi:hypothetical protein